MFDNNDRQELIKLVDKIHRDARECLEYDNVLPASITFNGDDVGVTIEFRKIFKETQNESV